MKAAPGSLPPVGDDWGFELKWDGMRILSHFADGQVQLFSGNGNDVTTSYPELHAFADALAGFDSLTLDGEVVAFELFGVTAGRETVGHPVLSPDAFEVADAGNS